MRGRAVGSVKVGRADSTPAGRRLLLLASSVVLLAGLVAGVGLVVDGVTPEPPAPAPLPRHSFSLPAGPLPPLPPSEQPGAADCSPTPGPSRIVIPSLCVDGPVVPVSVLPSGELEIPRNVRQVGRWDAGGTLLAGHVNSVGQGRGAFADLYRIRPGAAVHLTDEVGALTRWRVTELEYVVKAELPADLVDDAGRRLVMVTCGGPVETVPGRGNTYRNNIIVTALPL
ncbi:class F sortase [Actinophytocola sp.]|uniref:class F sortase n=1 Tax=Actinophytocola sp. TaxID=1872138 RepID=UPI002ED48667